MKGDNCEFLHQMDMDRMPVCRWGENCRIKDCPYKHEAEADKPQCVFYQQGFCYHGPECRYRHWKQAADKRPAIADFGIQRRLFFTDLSTRPLPPPVGSTEYDLADALVGEASAACVAKGAPPLVHHEDGFNADEARGLKIERNIYRRIALSAADALAVPSHVLEGIARTTWKQPAERVHRIPNGINTALYARDPEPKAIPGFVRQPKEVVVGALAGLRTVKNLPMLVRAMGGIAGKFRLVIVGEGPERATIQQAAAAMGIADRLVMPGFLDRPYRFIRHFDIVALSSMSEQAPISVLEGMAAGLPIASLPVGDVATMVSEANHQFIADRANEVRLRDVIQALILHPEHRAAAGAANQARARAEFDESLMVARYKALYEKVLGRPGAFG